HVEFIQRYLSLTMAHQQPLGVDLAISSYKMILRREVILSNLESIDMDLFHDITLILENNTTDLIFKIIIEYHILCHIHEQFSALLSGYSELIPQELTKASDEHGLKLFIGSMPDINVNDWMKLTDYCKYEMNNNGIQQLWQII
ncbi:hypothetical protein BS47DRAFT_1307001, partial [Hydnum rufescens UP504]